MTRWTWNLTGSRRARAGRYVRRGVIVSAAAVVAVAVSVAHGASAPSTFGECVVSGSTVTCTDHIFNCGDYNDGDLDFTLVKVTLSEDYDYENHLDDAFWSGLSGCTGTVDRVEIDTWIRDGIKISGAHDLTIDGGYVRCHAFLAQGGSQEAVGIFDGQDISLNNLELNCPSSNTATMFWSGGANPPGDVDNVVCDNCVMSSGSKRNPVVWQAGYTTDSGATNSELYACPDELNCTDTPKKKGPNVTGDDYTGTQVFKVEQCANTLDDDFDGLADYTGLVTGDAQCTTPPDYDESQ